MKRNKKPVTVLFSVFLSVSACGFQSSQTKPAEGKASSLDELVDVGGYRLCSGSPLSGSPSVVMDAGGFDSSEAWSKVQPEIAKFTRV